MENSIDHSSDYTCNTRTSQLPVLERISDLTHRTETDYDRITDSLNLSLFVEG
jgi:hypothetical protein